MVYVPLCNFDDVSSMRRLQWCKFKKVISLFKFHVVTSMVYVPIGSFHDVRSMR